MLATDKVAVPDCRNFLNYVLQVEEINTSTCTLFVKITLIVTIAKTKEKKLKGLTNWNTYLTTILIIIMNVALSARLYRNASNPSNNPKKSQKI